MKTTTIYVTQNLAGAMSIAGRVAVMKEGTIQQVDTPERVWNHPANNFVGGGFIKFHNYFYYLHTRRTKLGKKQINLKRLER